MQSIAVTPDEIQLEHEKAMLELSNTTALIKMKQLRSEAQAIGILNAIQMERDQCFDNAVNALGDGDFSDFGIYADRWELLNDLLEGDERHYWKASPFNIVKKLADEIEEKYNPNCGALYEQK